MFGWNKNPNEKRAFVKPGTNEAAPQVVTNPATGEVIGQAASPAEASKMVADNNQEWKEAA